MLGVTAWDSENPYYRVAAGQEGKFKRWSGFGFYLDIDLFSDHSFSEPQLLSLLKWGARRGDL